MTDAAAAVAEALVDARRIVVFTGAGISTASGIPDYRGPKGVWTTRRPVFFDEFVGDPDARERYWRQKTEDWQAWGRRARPNAVHASIVELERAGRLELVVTQNVDGLHRAAGTSPARLVEIHGTNRSVVCLRCGAEQPAGPIYDGFARTGTVPVCDCGGFLKPATISFGQSLRADDLERAFDAARRCDAVVSLGSTLTVTPAADVPATAARRGVPYVVVNRGATGHDDLATLRVEGDVTEVFPSAVGLLLGR